MPQQRGSKKHHSDITAPELEVVATLCHSHQPINHTPPPCPGCGSAAHRGGRRQCPAYNRTCAHYHKVDHFAKVCQSRQAQLLPSNNEHQLVLSGISVSYTVRYSCCNYGITKSLWYEQTVLKDNSFNSLLLIGTLFLWLQQYLVLIFLV